MKTAPLPFSGAHDTVAYRCHPARYSKNKMILSLVKLAHGDCFKDRAAWLAEALGGRWGRGHEIGYRMAPTRAEAWRILFLAGFSASRRYFSNDQTPYKFHLQGGAELSLADALRAAQSPSTQSATAR